MSDATTEPQRRIVEHLDAEPFGAGLRPFPDPATVAKLPDSAFAMPKARIATIRALADAINADEVVLDGSVDRDETRAALESIPGIGPWTASYVAMRALGDPDVFLPSDVAVRRAARELGLPDDRSHSHSTPSVGRPGARTQ